MPLDYYEAIAAAAYYEQDGRQDLADYYYDIVELFEKRFSKRTL